MSTYSQGSILAIDPGGTTGLARVSLRGKLISSMSTKKFETIIGYVLLTSPNVVIIEDFIGAGPRTKEAVQVLKLIGKIEGACHVFGFPVVMQNPQIRKPYRSLVVEQKLNITTHEEDAYAHALAYLDRKLK